MYRNKLTPSSFFRQFPGEEVGRVGEAKCWMICQAEYVWHLWRADGIQTESIQRSVGVPLNYSEYYNTTSAGIAVTATDAAHEYDWWRHHSCVSRLLIIAACQLLKTSWSIKRYCWKIIKNIHEVTRKCCKINIISIVEKLNSYFFE